jgi:hypothetical protein
MLVAKRDPFHPGPHDTPYPESGLRAPRAPGFVRAMSALQMVGTLLAIPVGIGSGYSIYRANFSVETTCQGLRTNIVSMLDKSVDAHTRHALVRRDVEVFEQRCGGVDPDATAAFKALIASDHPAAPAAAATVQRLDVKPAAEQPKQAVRKIEPQRPESVTRKAEPKAGPKAESTGEIGVESKPAQRDIALTDAAWLAAVRGALSPKDDEREQAEIAKASPVMAPPQPQPVVRETSAPAPLSVKVPAQPAAPFTVAPALPPPASISAAPSPQSAARDAEHPVPPAAIPAEKAAEPHTRIGGFVAQIPFVGQMIERR